jgi:hypothetical protein
MKRTLVSLTLSLGLGLTAASAFAQIDPQLYVCTGCTAPTGGDPNVINPASINIGFGGKHTAVAPLLVIVGVPNAGAQPTISLPNGVSPVNPFNDPYGASETGSLSTTTTNNAYAALGLNTGSGGGSSEQGITWANYDTAHGFTVGTSFSLYVFEINYALNSNPTTSTVNSPITIDFTNIAAGSFVVAYDCSVSGSTCTDGHIGETPFTNAGVVVPEPASLGLLVTALVGAYGLLRRKISQPSEGSPL